jgi:hypothetical protein
LNNIFASTDPWTAPIMATAGPDGALWVLDWYNYLNNHNGICGSAGCGTGAAMISSIRDTVRTRVYRVVYSGNPVDAILNLSQATDDQLIQTFYHTNMLWRLQAQRLLVKRGSSPALIAKLRAILDSNTVNSMGEAPHAIHALRTLEGFGLFAADPAAWMPVLRHAMLHPSQGVRWNAIDALPNSQSSIDAILELGRINDPNAHVRIMALYKLSTLTGTKSGQMYTPYVTLDTYSQNRFTAVTGLTQTATMPVIPPLRGIGTSIEATRPVFSRLILVSYRNGGFVFGGMEPWTTGSLIIHDVKGARVAQVPIAGGRAERPVALAQGAYLFRLELGNGATQNGKFSVFN